MKKIFYLTLLLFINYSGFSQDVIYTKQTTDSILSKIMEVNVADIKYKKHSNPNGPMYTINKTDILKIVYNNGDIEHYNKQGSKKFATVYVIRPRKNSI